MEKINTTIQIEPFIVMDIMRKAEEVKNLGNKIIHMEVGQPITAAPKKVIEAAREALLTNNIGYTTALGTQVLREKISEHYKNFYEISIPWEKVIITTGASAGFILATLACFNPKDNIVVTSPGYPCYRNILTALGLNVVNLKTTEATKFQPTSDLIERLDRKIDGIILTNPSNPTGTIIEEKELENLVNYCNKKGIQIISDEIYQGISFGNKSVSALKFNKNIIVINSFSKYFSMTGWRLGWMVIPQYLERQIELLAQNFYMSPPTLSQLAAVYAFDCHEELEQNIKNYHENRDALIEGLLRIGLRNFVVPEGAFYLYLNIEHFTNNSLQFACDFLEAEGVAITPGIDFDKEDGHKYIRFSYTGTKEDIIEGIEKLDRFIKKRK